LFRHFLRLFKSHAIRPDRQVSFAPATYGDPYAEELLQQLLPKVQRLTGLKLFPTYSYSRVYSTGAVLKRHTDRYSCEISVTANMGQRTAQAWPIWIENQSGAFPIAMNPGDAAVYRGIECAHWREPFAGELVAQVFLHYVDQNGRYADWKFDKRNALGIMPKKRLRGY
jgi:hypothetical protein